MTYAKKFTRAVAAATLAASAFALATPAVAQMVPFEDYEASDAVYEMVTVDIEPGEFETYLENLKNTWVAANEVAKRLGHIEDYAIYSNTNGAGDDFDLLLVIKYASTADLTPSRERYLEFMEAWGNQNEDSNQRTVREVYNKIRELTGQWHVREITLK
jgi:DNA polymerase III delta prime subunit